MLAMKHNVDRCPNTFTHIVFISLRGLPLWPNSKGFFRSGNIKSTQGGRKKSPPQVLLRMAALRCVANPAKRSSLRLRSALGRLCPIRAGRTVRLNLLGSTARSNAKLARPGRLAVNQSGSRCSQSERPVQPHPRASSIVVPRDVDHALSNRVKGLGRSLARTVSDRGAPRHWQKGFFDPSANSTTSPPTTYEEW